MVTVKELQENLKVTTKELQESFKAELETMKQDFTMQLKTQDVKINSLQDTVNRLTSKLSKLEKKCEDEDAYKRRDVIVISGSKVPPSNQGENCAELVTSLIKSDLKIELLPTDVSTAHRLGKVKPGTEDRRSIIVKLCRRDNKRNIMDACRKIKPTNLYVSEHLTPMRNTIMFGLRMMKKREGSRVVGCSSYNGNVSAWVKPPNAVNALKIDVDSRDTLEHVSVTFAGAPLTQFLSNWNH